MTGEGNRELPALYDEIGTTYSRFRRADPRIAGIIDQAVAGCATLLSVGAGTGSYEPPDRHVVGIEPSRTMIAQRSSASAPVVQAVAECLPFTEGSFDAAMAILTVHHWPDPSRGFAEMRRVASKQIILTWDPAVVSRYWLVADYLPELADHEAPLATLEAVCAGLDVVDVQPVPVPWDCIDGFMCAYWRRPERYLDRDARAAISGLSLLDGSIVDRAMCALAADLESGAWTARHENLLVLSELDVGYRLVIAG